MVSQFFGFSKNILLAPLPPRDLHIPEIPVVKEEPTTSKKADAKPKTPFSVMKPPVKSEAKKPEIKQEPLEQPPQKKIDTPPKPAEKMPEVKKEKSSPEDSKPDHKAATGKKVQLKNQKPVQKGSISSFFSNKPSTSAKPPAPKPVADKKEEEKPVEKAKTVANPEKAAKASDKKKETKKPAKKIQLKEPTGHKRSRIRVMQDSSDEEPEEKDDIDEPESKFIKFDREITPERDAKPIDLDESPEKEPEVGRVKHKAKRWVTKRFQTEDGFMRTERVQEEYSASEDENDENKKKNSPVQEKSKSVKKSPAEKKRKAAATETQGGKKQATMMSFFSKK